MEGEVGEYSLNMLWLDGIPHHALEEKAAEQLINRRLYHTDSSRWSLNDKRWE